MKRENVRTDYSSRVSPTATTERDTDLLTISEAAASLKVSTITLHRWLKQGRLRGYHVGPRAVRIRRSDLARLLVPRFREEVGAIMPVDTDLLIKPLTDEEVNQAYKALEDASALGRRILERRRGRPLAPSWSLLRRAREERSREP